MIDLSATALFVHNQEIPTNCNNQWPGAHNLEALCSAFGTHEVCVMNRAGDI
jgi:hypothetical protein